jgi:hypothetical protein
MLSLPSFYALGWAKEFCRRFKSAYPDIHIVAGGRWVTGPDPEWLRMHVPELDEICTGLGEADIGRLAGARLVYPPATLPSFALDHRLVDGFQQYQPSIEVSRGCGMGCAFCEERDVPLTRLREAGDLARMIGDVSCQYAHGEIRPYLQSSYFLPNVRWAGRMLEEMSRRSLRVRWRCETRVDSIKPDTIAYLAAAGLKVIDLGLETASPRQIAAMNKSADVDRYLRSASDLLRACERQGVWVKCNMLLYAGETASTVQETQAWLDQHATAIKGVSVGPVMVFGPPRQAAPLLEDLGLRGARPVDSASAERSGVSAMHLSNEIGAGEAEALSLQLSRRYMDAGDYFDLKGFSYYPRGFTRAAFDADVATSDPSLLPFRQ